MSDWEFLIPDDRNRAKEKLDMYNQVSTAVNGFIIYHPEMVCAYESKHPGLIEEFGVELPLQFKTNPSGGDETEEPKP